jgi:hypothetical protein
VAFIRDRVTQWLRRGTEHIERQIQEVASTTQQQSLRVGSIETLAQANALRLDHLLAQVDQLQRETRLLLNRLSLPNRDAWASPPDEDDAGPASDAFPRSTLCRQQSFDQPYFRFWTQRLGASFVYHRKLWEHVFILQALWERGVIRSGARGLGFGVGREPLPALFASEGCEITATDMDPGDAVEKGWSQSAQHAAGLDALRFDHICPPELFEQRIAFRVCDMNDISEGLADYDFCWSSCALEHLGSIEHGARFIESSIERLRPGGWAVHTTEFNLSSNSDTLEAGGTVLFRDRDLRELAGRLEEAGHHVAPLDLAPGDQLLDDYVDVPPYRPQPHLQLAIAGYACTSVGFIVQRRA